MACSAIITGDEFLLRVIGHIDCQAQVLGSYGYQALGQPGSLASTVVAGLLTLFVALFGIRLLFGPAPGARDTVFDVIKIGIVITLAFSWPAFRTVIHDVVLDGPAEIANAIVTPSLANQNDSFAQRLQSADVAMVRLAQTGTGRNTGAFLEGSDTGASFAGTGLQDDTALGYGRFTFLGGVIASFGLLRIIAALLLALTPLAAGLLLFEQTRGLFAGWLKGLTLAMLGSIGATVTIAFQLSVLEPWLTDALRVRGLGYAIPSAPMELMAINTAFAVVQIAMIWVLAKVVFNRGWPTIASVERRQNPVSGGHTGAAELAPAIAAHSRVQRISDSVEMLVRREETSRNERLTYRSIEGSVRQQEPSKQARAGTLDTSGRLGSSYRRSSYRNSSAARKRDGGS